MKLQTCRMGFHPFRHEVEEAPKAPEGPHGMMIRRLHTECRFCGKRLATRYPRIVPADDYIRGVR